MSQNLQQRADSLLEDLRAIDDRELRFELLIEYAERFKEVPTYIASRPFDPVNKVPACESDAYAFVVKNNQGLIQCHFAVENPQGISAKALATILGDLVNGSRPEELQLLDEQMVHEIFGKTISMGKGQGLMGMIRLVKELVYEIS